MHQLLVFYFSIVYTWCRYKFLKELGDGTCGTVYKAVNKENNEIVRHP